MFERPRLDWARFDGIIGDRLAVNQRNWLYAAPLANPMMVQMFDHKHPAPYGSHLWWSGEFVGKYLISAVQDLRMSHDRLLESTVSQVVRQLLGFQEADGYLGPFDGVDDIDGVGRRPSRLFGNNWDVWGHYHCVLGLFEWFRYCGDHAALDACIRAADHLSTRFAGGYISTLLHPAMNLTFAHVAALLYQETGHSRLLDLTRLFEGAWTSVTGGGDYVARLQKPGSFYSAMQRSAQNDARWERLHCLQAVGELFRITGSEQYRRAFINAWQGIRDFDRHITGGFSSLESATGNPYDPRPIETCATVAWMALTVDMLRLTGSSQAADELELSTWNAVLGAQSPDGRWWTYTTPMGGVPTTGMGNMWPPHPIGGRPPAFEGIRQPAPYDLAWQERPGAAYLSCCAANGPRGLGVLSEWAVMTASDGIVVNFYGPSHVAARVAAGRLVAIEQRTNYPFHGTVNLVVDLAAQETFTLQLRIPSWSTSTRVAVNGVDQGTIVPGGYFAIKRTWRRGDIITVALDLKTRAQIGAARPADSDPFSGHGAAGRVALYRGPILIAYDERDDRFNVHTVPPFSPTTNLVLDESAPSPEDRRFLRVRAQTSSSAVNLGDFASAGMTSTPLKLLTDALGRVFQFGRTNGTILAERIRLLADGTITGYTHPNEARWGWEDRVLTFIASDGRTSTRFVWEAWENGCVVLRGRSEIVTDIVHELREVDLRVDDKSFLFARVGEPTPLASALRLLPGGSIDDYNHPNERSWAREGDTLVFKAQDGRVSTRFTSTRTRFGRVEYQGRSLFAPGIVHRLRQIDRQVADKIWQFRRPSTAAISIRLHTDGTIESDHPNETYWVWDGPSLVFLDKSRSPTTRFTLTPDSDPQGRMMWTGPFVHNPAIIHRLVEWSIDVPRSGEARYISWLPKT